MPYRRLRKVALKGETKDGIEGKLINTRKEKKRGKLSNVNSASKQRVIVDLKEPPRSRDLGKGCPNVCLLLFSFQLSTCDVEQCITEDSNKLEDILRYLASKASPQF